MNNNPCKDIPLTGTDMLPRLKTPKAAGVTQKWIKADVVPPLLVYIVKDDSNKVIMSITFTPGKMKAWAVKIGDTKPAHFEGTRNDVQKFELCAEAMYIEHLKTAA